MPFESMLLSRVFPEESKFLYDSLHTALIEHDQVMLLLPPGVDSICCSIAAIKEFQKPTVQVSRLLLVVPSAHLVDKLAEKARKYSYKQVQIIPGLHTNSLLAQIRKEPEIVIGTPARLLSFFRKEYLNWSMFDGLIIDDVDQLTYLGYDEQLHELLESAGSQIKIILSSNLEGESNLLPIIGDNTRLIDQRRLNFTQQFHAFTVISNEYERIDALHRLLINLHPYRTLVFCNHRGAAIRLKKLFLARDVITEVLHGDLSELETNDILNRYALGCISILFTTDRAADDLSFPEVRYLIHYHLPLSEQAYLKRTNLIIGGNPFTTAFHILEEDEDQPPFIHTLPDVLTLPAMEKSAIIPYWLCIRITHSAGRAPELAVLLKALMRVMGIERDEIGAYNIGQQHSYIAVSQRKTRLLKTRMPRLVDELNDVTDLKLLQSRTEFD